MPVKVLPVALTRAGIAIRDIDNIFITHPHSDHTGGLGGLLASVPGGP
jgi:ribonuclease BN (tRNA processing enzyme)